MTIVIIDNKKGQLKMSAGNNIVEYSKGAYIILEGEKNADSFFIIRAGLVRIYRAAQAVDEPSCGVLGQGELFGVVSAMAGHGVYVETARALTDVTLITVRREQFTNFITGNVVVAVKIMLRFSEQMRYYNGALAANAAHKKSGAPQTGAAPAQTTEYEFEPDTQELVYGKNAVIFSEGEAGNEVFIIKSGSVKIFKAAENGEVLLAILSAGDIFGEMALLGSNPRAASAAVCEECRLIVLNREKFHQMIRTQPQLIYRLTAQLAKRIWLLYKQLANTMIPDPAGRMFDMLLVGLEKARVDLNTKAPYHFEFGASELVAMTGLPRRDTVALTERLLQNRYVEITPQGRIAVKNVLEFARQAAYFRKMQMAAEKERRQALS